MHYSTLYLSKLDKKLSESQIREVCERHGKVMQVRLICGQDRTGKTVSFGKATVTYAKKEEATEAQRKLHFEDKLGELVQVDFYKSKQLRMAEQQNVTNVNDSMKLLAQYMMKNHNNSQGYGAGMGQY